MKKSVCVLTVMSMVVLSAPAFADSGSSAPAKGNGGFLSVASSEQTRNVQVGSRNVATGWVESLDSIHNEAAKGKNAPEHLTGVVAGSAIGVRRTIHRVGAGAIDLATFWIPKKKSLVEPEKARLE